MTWPTGNTLSGGWVVVRLLFPPDPWFHQSLLGAANYLGFASAWEGDGDILPSTAALVFQKAFETSMIQNPSIGQIVCFPADNMQYIGQNPANGPSQWLKCDGSSLLKSAYPDLYAVIGNTFGSDTTHFSIPDLRGRVVVDAGSGSGLTPRSLGDVLGEENHLLSSTEMPTHTHTESATAPTAITIGPGAPAPSAIPAAGITGAAGGGRSHNNIQPSLVLFYYIQAFL